MKRKRTYRITADGFNFMIKEESYLDVLNNWSKVDDDHMFTVKEDGENDANINLPKRSITRLANMLVPKEGKGEEV